MTYAEAEQAHHEAYRRYANARVNYRNRRISDDIFCAARADLDRAEKVLDDALYAELTTPEWIADRSAE